MDHLPLRQHQPGKNYLLELLPAADRARVLDTMERLSAPRLEPVFKRHVPLTYVDFPLSGVISVVSVTRDGGTVEIATIGNEGMSGLSALFRAESDAYDAYYQVAGETVRMPIAAFERELERESAFFEVLQRYAQTFHVHVAQSVACNRLHEVVKRLCRWILMAQDRIGQAKVPLTQEFLAMMLGVRRASVTTAALHLQKSGLISYHRGLIEVLNRRGLEAGACECYSFVTDEYQRLLAEPPQFISKPYVGVPTGTSAHI
jgi:CRP-like cAMP-binding protein